MSRDELDDRDQESPEELSPEQETKRNEALWRQARRVYDEPQTDFGSRRIRPVDTKNIPHAAKTVDGSGKNTAPNAIKTHKVVTVEAFVPEAKGNAFFAAKGEGHDWPLATYRALKVLAEIKGIKRKRITTIKATISIGTVIDE